MTGWWAVLSLSAGLPGRASSPAPSGVRPPGLRGAAGKGHLREKGDAPEVGGKSVAPGGLVGKGGELLWLRCPGTCPWYLLLRCRVTLESHFLLRGKQDAWTQRSLRSPPATLVETLQTQALVTLDNGLSLSVPPSLFVKWELLRASVPEAFGGDEMSPMPAMA